MGTDDLAFRLTHPLAKGPATMSSTPQRVQCFGKKKTATAVAQCKAGKGLVKVNGRPLQLVQPEILRFKVYEPLLVLASISSPTSTSACASLVVVKLRRSTPSARLSPSPSSPTTRSSSTSTPRTC